MCPRRKARAPFKSNSFHENNGPLRRGHAGVKAPRFFYAYVFQKHKNRCIFVRLNYGCYGEN